VQAEGHESVPAGGAGRDRPRCCGGDQVVSCQGGSCLGQLGVGDQLLIIQEFFGDYIYIVMVQIKESSSTRISRMI